MTKAKLHARAQLSFSWSQPVEVHADRNETRGRRRVNARDRGCCMLRRVSPAGRSASFASVRALEPITPQNDGCTPAEASEARARLACDRLPQLDGVAFERALSFARLDAGQLKRLVLRQPAAVIVAWFWVALGTYPATRYVDITIGRLGATVGGCS